MGATNDMEYKKLGGRQDPGSTGLCEPLSSRRSGPMITDPMQYPGRKSARRFAAIMTFTSFTVAVAALLAGCGAGGTSATQVKPTPLPDPVPVIAGIAPSSGTIQGGTTVNVSGSGFLGTTTLSIDGKSATIVSVDILGTRLTARTPTNFNRLGAVDVVVSARGGSATLPGGFTITPASVTFNTSITLAVGPDPARLKVRDMNNDGINDIVTGNRNGFGVTCVINNGNRTFRSPASSPLLFGCTDMGIGDLSGDLLPDILFVGEATIGSEPGGGVAYLTNNGDGTFVTTVNTSTSALQDDGTIKGVQPTCAEVLQVDGQSFDEAVVGRPRNQTAEGGRDFIDLFRFPPRGLRDQFITTGNNATDMEVADLNNDGNKDLVTACSQTGEIHALFGGGLAFTLPGVFLSHALISRVVIDDVDLDSILDIIGIGGDAVTVYYGDGAGNFPVNVRYDAIGVVTAAFQDINGDSIKDMVFSTGGTTKILERTSAREMTGLEVTFVTGLATVTELVVANIDGDPMQDLVCMSQGVNLVRIFPNATNFPTALVFSQSQNLVVGSGPEGVDARDLDEDGDIDLVVSAPESGARAYLGDGSGKFEASSLDQASTPLLLGSAGGEGDGGTSRIEADIDGDGDIDQLEGLMDRGVLEVTLSDGQGGTARRDTYEAGGGAHALATGDLDGDGRLDVVVANTAAGTVTLFTNKGDGSLAAAGTYAVGTSPIDISIGDVNGDGRPDVMVANFDSGTATVLTQE